MRLHILLWAKTVQSTSVLPNIEITCIRLSCPIATFLRMAKKLPKYVVFFKGPWLPTFDYKEAWRYSGNIYQYYGECSCPNVERRRLLNHDKSHSESQCSQLWNNLKYDVGINLKEREKKWDLKISHNIQDLCNFIRGKIIRLTIQACKLWKLFRIQKFPGIHFLKKY